MRENAGFVIGTLLTWLGAAFTLRAVFIGLKIFAVEGDARPPLRVKAAISAVIAALALIVGNRLVAAHELSIPIVWFVMPFAAWAVVVSVAFMIARLVQAGGGINPDEQRARLKAALAWAVATAGFIAWYKLDPEASIKVIKGGIPIGLPTLLALILLAVATVAVMVFTARAAKARGIAKGFATHLALIVGSILFGLPLVWLVITSFKEDIDMASPNGIVWVPRVQETVPYLDPDHPVFATIYQGTQVQGSVMERRPDGSVKLDVNKPMSMRGTTVEVPSTALKQVPVDAPLVTVQMDGQTVRGEVVEEMEDGHKRVQAISPPALEGRQQVYAPADVTPIRKIGLRTQNYPDALDFLPPEANRGLTYLENTLILVVLGLAGTILSSAIVAYAFSRMRFPGRDVMFWLMLATMMLPGAVTKLPQFMIFKQLGWIDTLYPLWVPAFFASAFNVFMLRQFFKQIPMELEDAAKIDGAGYFRTFWSVMMPQIKPALAVIAILTFVGTWNNFFDPLIYLNSPENMTISYAVQLYANDRSSEPGLVTAFTTLAMLPVLTLFFFAQKYFIEGVTLTGMGGR